MARSHKAALAAEVSARPTARPTLGELDELLGVSTPRLVSVPDTPPTPTIGETSDGGGGDHSESGGEGRGSGLTGGPERTVDDADVADATPRRPRRGSGAAPVSPRPAGEGAAAPAPGLGNATLPDGQVRSGHLTAAPGRLELLDRLSHTRDGWDQCSVWRARNDVVAVGYGVPDWLAVELRKAKLSLAYESGLSVPNEVLISQALEMLPDDPTLMAADLESMEDRLRTKRGRDRRVTGYVRKELKQKLDTLVVRLDEDLGKDVPSSAVYAVALSRLIDTIGQDGDNRPSAPNR
jgi:hypothetical protein